MSEPDDPHAGAIYPIRIRNTSDCSGLAARLGGRRNAVLQGNWHRNDTDVRLGRSVLNLIFRCRFP